MVGVPDPALGDEVAPPVVGPDGRDASALQAFGRERVAAYAYPRLTVPVDEPPHGPTGKVPRRAIDRDDLARRLAEAVSFPVQRAPSSSPRPANPTTSAAAASAAKRNTSPAR